MRTRSQIMFLWALVGSAALSPVAQAQVVVPNGLENVEGNSSNTIPFAISPPVRYQQVYLGSELQRGWISAISFRLDGVASAFGPNVFNDVQLILSSTSAGPDSLSSTFDNNLGGDSAVIFQGSVSLSSTAVGDPKPFDITLTAQSPFFFDPQSGGNLLVELVLGSDSDSPIDRSLDVEAEIGDSVGRAICQGAADCETADSAPDTVGLVTRFTMAIFVDGFESSNTSAWSGAVP